MDELIVLAAVLRIPDPLISSGHYRALALEALALTCAHLHSLEDQWMIGTKYHHPQYAISEITHEVISHINRVWGHLLDFNVNGIFAPLALARYTNALHAHGAPTCTIIGFIDCTIVQTCHPSVSEKLVYTGYKKFHGMKFQAIMVPNGMISHLDGPYRAPQNDASILSESGLLGHMHTHAIQPGSVEGDPPEQRYFQLYGDSAYAMSGVLVSPHVQVGVLTAAEQAWNMAMGEVHISAEHAFRIVLQEWLFLCCSWKHHILGTACGLLLCCCPHQCAQCFCAQPDC